MSPRPVPFDLLRELILETPSKIVLFVVDGLGGLPDPATGRTELESARTPNLDALAAASVCGLSEPVGAGIAPGSGPGHLALFGYDPIASLVGRGILSALGVDFPMEPSDVAARINFASVDAQGKVTDRRAGRISTDTNRRLVEKLGRAQVPGLRVFLETESEHRAVAIFRGERLSDRLGRAFAVGDEAVHAGQLRDSAVHRIGGDRGRAQAVHLGEARQLRQLIEAAQQDHVGRRRVVEEASGLGHEAIDEIGRGGGGGLERADGQRRLAERLRVGLR